MQPVYGKTALTGTDWNHTLVSGSTRKGWLLHPMTAQRPRTIPITDWTRNILIGLFNYKTYEDHLNNSLTKFETWMEKKMPERERERGRRGRERGEREREERERERGERERERGPNVLHLITSAAVSRRQKACVSYILAVLFFKSSCCSFFFSFICVKTDVRPKLFVQCSEFNLC